MSLCVRSFANYHLPKCWFKEERNEMKTSKGELLRLPVRTFSGAAALTAIGLLVLFQGAALGAEGASGEPLAKGAAGPADYVVIYKENVELGTRLKREARRGNEIEERFTSSVNGALLELSADEVDRLRQEKGVEAVERDRWVRVETSERSGADSRNVIPWGLDRINQRELPLDGAISTSKDGTGVEVYVIDTGIRLDHTEFKGRINPEGFSAYGSPEDCEGHGTHVAGTIAGAHSGVAPAANLTAVRVLSCNGMGLLSDVVAGIDWMISDYRADDGGSDRQTLPSRSKHIRNRELARPRSTKDFGSSDASSAGSVSSNSAFASNFGTGFVEGLRHSGYGNRYEYRISATTNSSICRDSGSCGWFPVAYAFPADRQCQASGEGGTFAWVGDFQSQIGTQTADQFAYLASQPPWRFCVYVYAHGSYHLVHETIISPGQGADRPLNDDFVNRQKLTSLESTTGSSLNATTEADEPYHHGSQSPRSSVWWQWTAPADGTLVLDTSGSSFDTVLAVYSGSMLNSLQNRASDDDSGEGTASQVSLKVVRGEVYPITVDGYRGATGAVRLNGSFTKSGGPGPFPIDPVPGPVSPDPVRPDPDPANPLPDPEDPGPLPEPGNPTPDPIVTDPDPPAEIEPQGPAVANLSFGSSFSPAINAATERAIDAGITVVVAAGNGNRDACEESPASTLDAITVGSTGRTDQRSSFSNTGRCVDVFAPGESVVSAGIFSDTSSAILSGTSMAAPHVTGAAALLLGEDPSLNPRQVSERIGENATPSAVGGVDPATSNRMLFISGAAPRVSAPDGDIPVNGNRSTATIVLSAPSDGSYECSLNGENWNACRPGPIRVPNLPLGSHGFWLRSVIAGIQSREKVATWRYVPAAPHIVRGPRTGASRKASLLFERIDGLRAECRLDRGPWQLCRVPKVYRGLQLGRHSFEVRQASGDLVSSVARWTWNIARGASGKR